MNIPLLFSLFFTLVLNKFNNISLKRGDVQLDKPVLIPEPKKITFGGIHVLQERVIKLQIPEGSPLILTTAVLQLSNWFGEYDLATEYTHSTKMNLTNNGASYPFTFTLLPDHTEKYTITASADECRIQGSAAGMAQAVQTLLQLLKTNNQGELMIPLVDIEDWPDIALRGIFTECFSGPDLMNLADWHQVIDEMISCKLNLLCVGLYGGWERRHPLETDSRPEYLFAPVLDDPNDLPSTKLHFHDPSIGHKRTLEYVPVIYEEDLFKEIVVYASERGMRVVPLFNGPGHSTLLPTLYPNISAADQAGKPSGYGYTFTHPDTFALLKRIFKRIIDRYLLPYGQRWFHIGMDEVLDYYYMNEEMGDRPVSPWSAADLKEQDKKEIVFRYLTELGQFLLDNGMEKVIIWHDEFLAQTNFGEEFVSRIKSAGLSGKLALHWWKYRESALFVKHVAGTETWIAPSTGYLPALMYQDFLENIDMVIDECEVEVSAVVAYAIHSPTHHRNTCYLGEKTWNRSANALRFEQTYSVLVAGTGAVEAAKAFQLMRCSLGYWPVMFLINELPVYFGNYFPKKPYPARILNAMFATQGIRDAYYWIKLQMEKTVKLLNKAISHPGKEYLLEYNRFECRKLAGLIGVFLTLADAANKYDQANRFYPEKRGIILLWVQEDLNLALKQLDEVLLDIHHNLPHYYVPSSLRELTPLRDSIVCMQAIVEEGIRQLDRVSDTESGSGSDTDSGAEFGAGSEADSKSSAWHHPLPQLLEGLFIPAGPLALDWIERLERAEE